MDTALNQGTAAQEVDRAVRTAHDAYRSAAARPLETRAGWLVGIGDALAAHEAELVTLAAEETQLAEPRLRGELRRTVFQLELLAEEVRSGLHLDAVVDHADPGWGMGPRPDIRRLNVPLGVVGVFGASNFPFAFSVMGGDSAAALAAGCAVVHKVHPGHPVLARRTTAVIVDALDKLGAPDALFCAVEGHDAGLALVDHPLVKAVGFTGSTAGGRALFDRACARPEPIPFFGELGSINPVFVLPQAWRARASEILQGYTASYTLGMGQFCTKPGLLFAPAGQRGDGDRVLEVLTEAARAVPESRLLTPSLRASYRKALAEVTGLDGVEVLVPGSDEEAPGPTVLSVDAGAVLTDPGVLHREMFGPATVLVRYHHAAQLRPLAELLGGQLTATVHADEGDDDTAELVEVLSTRAGRVLWNGWPTGVTVSYAQHHGGPYPATTAPSATSVGTGAIGRFMRPVAYQDLPQRRLPPALRDDNPWGITRRVDGRFEAAPGGAR